MIRSINCNELYRYNNEIKIDPVKYKQDLSHKVYHIEKVIDDHLASLFDGEISEQVFKNRRSTLADVRILDYKQKLSYLYDRQVDLKFSEGKRRMRM